MKILNILTIAIFGSIYLASCTTQVIYTSVDGFSSSTQNEKSLSNQVLYEVNGYRRKKGRQALTHHTGLAALARSHAQFLRVNRAKKGIRSSDANHHGFGNRVGKAQQTMGFRKVAENVVACRSGSGTTIVRLWSQSGTHEKTMIEAYQFTGIGTVVDGDGVVFSVQLFGTKNQYDSRTSAHNGTN